MVVSLRLDEGQAWGSICSEQYYSSHKSPSPFFAAIGLALVRHLYFASALEAISDQIIQKLTANGRSFNGVHLRIEEDFIRHPGLYGSVRAKSGWGTSPRIVHLLTQMIFFKKKLVHHGLLLCFQLICFCHVRALNVRHTHL